MNLEAIFREAAERNATDIHLSVHSPPRIRTDGVLAPVGEEDLTAEDTERVARLLLTEAQYEAFRKNRSVDFAYGADGFGRFRVNVYYQHGAVSIALRKLADEIRSLEALGLPRSFAKLVEFRDGLVLVTGPTGSGKSTTLATLIDMINAHYPYNIITIEDPIEYVHEHKKSLVNQRELNVDVNSFEEALRYALREDPDVILVGEMRDLETMRTAIMAAETGHLVFSTLHSRSASSAIDRMAGVFPPVEQQYIRHQLATTLRSTVSQRLLGLPTGPGRVPAVEVMFVTPAISNLIRLGKTEQLYAQIETGSKYGMQTMEQCLCEMYRTGVIDRETAMRAASNPKLLEGRIRHTEAPGRPVGRR